MKTMNVQTCAAMITVILDQRTSTEIELQVGSKGRFSPGGLLAGGIGGMQTELTRTWTCCESSKAQMEKDCSLFANGERELRFLYLT